MLTIENHTATPVRMAVKDIGFLTPMNALCTRNYFLE
jgi:hypothetical protein